MRILDGWMDPGRENLREGAKKVGIGEARVKAQHGDNVSGYRT